MSPIQKTAIGGLIVCIFPHIWISIPLFTNHACAFQQKDGFILHDSFCSLLSNQYISNISNIYNRDKILSLESQTICDHVFSDPKLDHLFTILCFYQAWSNLISQSFSLYPTFLISVTSIYFTCHALECVSHTCIYCARDMVFHTILFSFSLYIIFK